LVRHLWPTDTGRTPGKQSNENWLSINRHSLCRPVRLACYWKTQRGGSISRVGAC
jgi:hypothetical protein